jgi:hypothetical protein
MSLKVIGKRAREADSVSSIVIWISRGGRFRVLAKLTQLN